MLGNALAFARVVIFLSQYFYLLYFVVPFDGVNVSLSHLEEIMKNTKAKEITERHPYNGMVYLLPILHNPRGTSYTEGEVFSDHFKAVNPQVKISNVLVKYLKIGENLMKIGKLHHSSIQLLNSPLIFVLLNNKATVYRKNRKSLAFLLVCL